MSGTDPLFPPVLCSTQCKRCGTLSMGESWEGQLFKCPGCGIYFRARIEKAK